MTTFKMINPYTQKASTFEAADIYDVAAKLGISPENVYEDPDEFARAHGSEGWMSDERWIELSTAQHKDRVRVLVELIGQNGLKDETGVEIDQDLIGAVASVAAQSVRNDVQGLLDWEELRLEIAAEVLTSYRYGCSFDPFKIQVQDLLGYCATPPIEVVIERNEHFARAGELAQEILKLQIEMSSPFFEATPEEIAAIAVVAADLVRDDPVLLDGWSDHRLEIAEDIWREYQEGEEGDPFWNSMSELLGMSPFESAEPVSDLEPVVSPDSSCLTAAISDFENFCKGLGKEVDDAPMKQDEEFCFSLQVNRDLLLPIFTLSLVSILALFAGYGFGRMQNTPAMRVNPASSPVPFTPSASTAPISFDLD